MTRHRAGKKDHHMTYRHLIASMLLLANVLMAQTEMKSIQAVRVTEKPILDGVLDDSVWDLAPIATDFYRFIPESGGHAPVRTEARFVYDDVALYVAVKMYDPDPANIGRQLGKRDDDDVVADWIGFWINPFNDKANEVNFTVTAAGVQIDAKYSPDDEDFSWDPVWNSAVAFHDEGWSTELEIPFSQIRFPSSEEQTWGLNMARYNSNTRELYTWKYLDKTNSNYATQTGELTGIRRLQTPLRLSFTPYLAATAQHFPFDAEGKSNFSSSFRGGMDLKYGINQSFTLDMTLIPDFGQVQSDNVVLNLSPYEIRYDEHRPFFTEGTELLNKAGLFYSRRVGARPRRHDQVADGDILEEGETVVTNPDETQMINATKVTGQTVKGVGLGFFNALTAKTEATIRDSLGQERQYLTNPLTNYNLMVVSKNLQNGSDISLVNSNVQRLAGDDSTNDFRDANVLGFESRFVTRDSKWILEANAAYSQLFYPDSVSDGYTYGIEFSEEQGYLHYGAGHGVESENYNPNDLGYLQQPNEITQYGWLNLHTLDRIGRINEASLDVNGYYTSIYQPRNYSRISVNVNYNLTFTNYYSLGGGFFIQPLEGRDYYESRVAGKYFTTVKWLDWHVWVSSNYNKPFSMDMWTGKSVKNRRDATWWGSGINPRWRINNKWYLSYNLEKTTITNDHGFATLDSLNLPVFGRRDQTTITNSLYSTYIFSPNLESEIRFRHYRSTLKYHEYFDLLDDGELSPRSFNEDFSQVFNAFNIDAVLTWRFLPGSEVNLTWKNAIHEGGEDPGRSYLDDLKSWSDFEQSNTISLKLLYYVDAWDLKHHF